MEWKVENGRLILHSGDKTYNKSWEEILDIESGKSLLIDGKRMPAPSEQLKIDFSLSSFFSSLKAVVYLPSSKNDVLPSCQFVISDPDYSDHEIPEIPNKYIVIDGLFLICDDNQAKELGNLFSSSHSGPIGYRQVAFLRKQNSPYIEFVTSDEHCSAVHREKEQSNVRSILFPYQLQGVDWMDMVISEDTGFVLADEMGLGKTVQMITVIDEQRAFGPSLLIVPNSLLENWSREIKRFAPDISFIVDAGNSRQNYYKRLLKYDLVITSYDIARLDSSVFYSIDWNLIILDEAQAIKNSGSLRSKEIKTFRKRSGIAITGTPLENHLTDIWSIYDFCFPGLLGTISEFKEHYSDDTDSSTLLEQIISPLMLRRRVRDVRKDLKPVITTPIALSMNPYEAEGYERFRTEYIEENGFNLGVINKLRRYCALPSLVDENQKEILPFDMSAKFSYLFEGILDEIFAMKEKVLIFTDAIGAQQAIAEEIKARYAVFCVLLNGSVPISERQSVIDEFSSKVGFAVLIINPTVGATGLNITAANHVIFYTLDWNPASEDQCIARAARIGQKKNVFVYRMFYADTVEDEINNCLDRKRQLQDSAVKGTTAEVIPDIKRALEKSPFIRGEI